MKTKPKTKSKSVVAASSQPVVRSHPYRVPYALVRPDPNQPRKDFNETLLRELADSIKQQGIVHKLLVVYVPAVRVEEPGMFDEKQWSAVEEGTGRVVSAGSEEAVRKFVKNWQGDYYMIVDGERRWRAAGLAGLKEVPIDCRQLTEKDIRNIQLISAMQRENLSALEEAAAFARELDLRKQTDPAFNPEKLGKELGKKRSTIYNRLALLRLHEPVRQALVAGKIDITVAGLISQIPDQQLQLDALNEAAADEHSGPRPFRWVKQMIDQRYARTLNSKLFHLEKVYAGTIEGREGPAGDLAAVGTCEKCPRRSGNMTGMDAKSPNVCTDLPCFEAKRKSAELRRLEQAQAEGRRVMSDEQFQANRASLVRGNQTCYEDSDYREWRELMGKHAPEPILVQRDEGVVEMWPRDEAEAAAKKNGIKFHRSSGGDDNASRLRAERKKRFTAVCHVAAGKILDRTVLKKGMDERLWTLLAEELTGRLDIESHAFVARRRGLARTIGEVRPALTKWLKEKHTLPELQSYIVELLLCTRWNDSWNVAIGKRFKSLCALARVDLKKCEEEAAAGNTRPKPVQQELPVKLAKAKGKK